jgi:hypothetical protein
MIPSECCWTSYKLDNYAIIIAKLYGSADTDINVSITVPLKSMLSNNVLYKDKKCDYWIYVFLNTLTRTAT